MRTFRAETRKAASIQSKTLPSALIGALNVIRVAHTRLLSPEGAGLVSIKTSDLSFDSVASRPPPPQTPPPNRDREPQAFALLTRSTPQAGPHSLEGSKARSLTATARALMMMAGALVCWSHWRGSPYDRPLKKGVPYDSTQ